MGTYLEGLGRHGALDHEVYDSLAGAMDRTAVASRIAGPVLGWLAGGDLPRSAPLDLPAVYEAFGALRAGVLGAGLAAAELPFPLDLAGGAWGVVPPGDGWAPGGGTGGSGGVGAPGRDDGAAEDGRSGQ